MSGTQLELDALDRQRRYVDQQARGRGLGVVFADAFLRGMRDIGYKSPAWALAELVDNSLQAGATTVGLGLGFNSENKSKAKPDQIAVVDDGAGMIPEMLSYAVRWGGTDREGERVGFGRYGYGLPSAAVSMAKRYTVYSKVDGGDWHAVTVDIEELAAASGDMERTEALLVARRRTPPEWVSAAGVGLELGHLRAGTVIVLEALDRLRSMSGWIMTKSLQTKLIQHFGVIYRHWLAERSVFVHGTRTEPLDPLFLMENGRLFDETEVRAERVETRRFEVETARGTKGMVKIRAALLPPNFQLKDPKGPLDKGSKGSTNARFKVMKEYNGLLICRGGRQIDCIQPRKPFINYDRNLKIEIDFDPELDEFFGVTTAKQQIVLGQQMWEKLEGEGRECGALISLIKGMRARRSLLKDELNARLDEREAEEGAPRQSIQAMERTEDYKALPAPEPSKAQREQAERNLEREARARAEIEKTSEQEMIDKVRAETKARRWEIKVESIPEGPFFRPVRLGEQKRVIINSSHPFYQKLYDSARESQPALQVLLMVLAEAELESLEQHEQFYRSQRNRWSERLKFALDDLISDSSLEDRAAAAAVRLAEHAEDPPPTDD